MQASEAPETSPASQVTQPSQADNATGAEPRQHVIREVRREELDEVMRFAEQYGCAPAPDRLRLRTSLAARDGQGQLKGAVLAQRGNDSSVELWLVVAEGEEAELPERLIDKALMKMRCDHVHRCLIRLNHQEQATELWHRLSWAGHDLPREPRHSFN